MSTLYVIGGRQRQPRALRDGQRPWQGYDQGLVLSVDVETGGVNTSLRYGGIAADDDAAVSFQASTIDGNILYTCTETEVLTYRLPDFELLGHVSLPWFNDVHHVRPSLNGNIVVANAGLEMVLEITPAGEVVRLWDVL